MRKLSSNNRLSTVIKQSTVVAVGYGNGNGKWEMAAVTGAVHSVLNVNTRKFHNKDHKFANVE